MGGTENQTRKDLVHLNGQILLGAALRKQNGNLCNAHKNTFSKVIFFFGTISNGEGLVSLWNLIPALVANPPVVKTLHLTII